MSDSKLSEHLANLQSYAPKQLRTLRNSLNNRIKAMEEKGEESVKALSPSHRLFGLELVDCQKLLKAVRQSLKEL